MPSQPCAPTEDRPAQGLAAFVRGALDVWRGFAFLLGRPALWIWAVIPFAINLAIFGLCAWLSWHTFNPWLHARLIEGHAWGWLWTMLGWLIGALFWVIVLLVVAFCFIPIATLVAAPFNDILSERVEAIYAGARAVRFNPRDRARCLWISIHTSLWLTVQTMGLLALTVPVHFFVPGVGSLAASVLAAGISIWFLSLQFTAYSMDRRFYTIRERAAFQRRHRARSLGLGAMSFAIMLIPLVNALFISVSAVAGTLLFCDAEGVEALRRG